MGLLDDAIREHLELKRRRGADPSEVAREQREALDTPVESQPAGQDIDELEAHEVTRADAEMPPVAVAAEDGVGGETAELDMQAVLADDAHAATAPHEEDSLEWETPPHGAAAHPDETGSSAIE